MKRTIQIFLLLFMTQFIYSQENIYIDEKGDTISKGKYYRKWKSKKLLLSTWQHKDKNGKKYYTLKNNLYLKGTTNYENIKSKIKELTNLKIPDSSILLIRYSYKDDLCVPPRDNDLTKEEIINRNNYNNKLRKEYSKKGVFYISLYENGIILDNDPYHGYKYFFNDKNNFFKNKFFFNPALCGSFALIKSNGQYIIRNGEYRGDWMVNHLKPENWKLFFDKL